MEALMYIIILFFNALVCRRLAYYSTVPWGPLFPFKPFNCDACLTFWYTLVSSLFWAWLLSESTEVLILFGAVSFVSTIINFVYIKSKIQINE